MNAKMIVNVFNLQTIKIKVEWHALAENTETSSDRQCVLHLQCDHPAKTKANCIMPSSSQTVVQTAYLKAYLTLKTPYKYTQCNQAHKKVNDIFS